MGDQTNDQMADNMAAAASTAFNQFGEALKGSGAAAYHEWGRAQADASMLSQLGSMAADNIRKLNAREDTPAEWRRTESARIYANAEMLMDATRDALIRSVETVKANLIDAVKPAPNSDAGSRQLVRSELEMMVGAAPPAEAMLSVLLRLVGTRPDWDSEILSSWGTAKLHAAGQGSDAKALQNGAAYKLVQQPGGTEKQISAKRALEALKTTNVEGHIAAYYQSGKFRLSGVRPAQRPDTIVPSVRNAPTPTIEKSKTGRGHVR